MNEDRKVFVIPNIIGLEKVLKSVGYMESRFFVPFSHDDYPVKHEDEWKEKIRKAKKISVA